MFIEITFSRFHEDYDILIGILSHSDFSVCIVIRGFVLRIVFKASANEAEHILL